MVTWIMQNASDIVHDIKMTYECVVSHRRDISLYMISRLNIALKVLGYY